MPGNNSYPDAPLLPGWEGGMNAEFVRRIQLTRSAGRELLRGAQLFAAATLTARPTGSTSSTRSSRSSPSPHRSACTLKGPGYYDISGIALFEHRPHREGHGLGRGVEQGRSGAAGPVNPKNFSRFPHTLALGRPARGPAQSRAWDEASNAQPLRSGFSRRSAGTSKTGAERARHNNHYNSLTEQGHRQQRGDQACLRHARLKALAAAPCC